MSIFPSNRPLPACRNHGPRRLTKSLSEIDSTLGLPPGICETGKPLDEGRGHADLGSRRSRFSWIRTSLDKFTRLKGLTSPGVRFPTRADRVPRNPPGVHGSSMMAGARLRHESVGLGVLDRPAVISTRLLDGRMVQLAFAAAATSGRVAGRSIGDDRPNCRGSMHVPMSSVRPDRCLRIRSGRCRRRRPWHRTAGERKSVIFSLLNPSCSTVQARSTGTYSDRMPPKSDSTPVAPGSPDLLQGMQYCRRCL